MARTEDQKRDAYYTKKYGVGLDWYEARFAEQEGRCGVCRRPQEMFTNRFAIDHDHGWRKVKIESIKGEDGKWRIAARYLGHLYMDIGWKKNLIVRALRKTLQILSCRGLLCPFCNRGLRFYADDPTRLANASEYLRRHQNA